MVGAPCGAGRQRRGVGQISRSRPLIYAEEDDSVKGKAEMLKEIQPLPKGLGGEIKVELLSYTEDGDTRGPRSSARIETEHYYGQTIHATYLTNTVVEEARGRLEADRRPGAGRTHRSARDDAIRASDLATIHEGPLQAAGIPIRSTTLALTDGKLMVTRAAGANVCQRVESRSTRDVFFIPGDNRIRKIFLQRDTPGHVTGFIERRESSGYRYWVKAG